MESSPIQAAWSFGGGTLPITQPITSASALAKLVAALAERGITTPYYLYDLGAMANAARSLRQSFSDSRFLIAYALKANSAGPVLKTLLAEGCGLDLVSGGELALALAVGCTPDRMVYNGVAKTDAEIEAALMVGERGIYAIQAESVEELDRVNAVAKRIGRVARVSFRVNPEVNFDELDTHANIATGHDEAKFGIPLADVERALARTCELAHIRLVGLATHIGSQLRDVDAYLESTRRLFALAADARKSFPLEFVDTGGGFGIPYVEGEPCASPGDFIRAVAVERTRAKLDDLVHVCEPGRALVAPYGILVARVIQRKETRGKRWLMIDAGMNDLMRPALYQARHRVAAIDGSPRASERARFRVVGPVCESSDDFGVHELPVDIDGTLALLDAGAYGYTMASEYNGRALPHEVFVRDGNVVSVMRARSATDWARARLADA